MNKVWKVLLPVVLAMALLTASLPAFAAASSPTTKAIGLVVLASHGRYNNHQPQWARLKVYDTNGDRVPEAYYSVAYSRRPVTAGTYRILVMGKAPYTGYKRVIYKVFRAVNPFTIKAGKTTFKRDTTKNQTTTIRLSGVRGGAGRSVWSTTNPGVYVSGGRVIVKKGFSGTAVLSITVYGTENYMPSRKNITIKVTQ